MNKIYNNLTIENLIRTDWFNQFYQDQQDQILEGLKSDIDVSLYAKTDFCHNQMRNIRIALEKNLDFSDFINSLYHYINMEQIRLGLEDNLDISWYTNPEFDW